MGKPGATDTVVEVSRLSIAQRSELFGFDSDRPWAFEALRLVFSAPRVFEPLTQAWIRNHPEVKDALSKLVADGWVAHQGPLVIDVRDGTEVQVASRRVSRWKTTSKGRHVALEAQVDPRTLAEHWPQLTEANQQGVADLLAAFDLRGSHARFGISAPHAIEESKMAPRTGRWWVRKLEEAKLIRQVSELPDRRELIPQHWRPTRVLCKQLNEVFVEHPRWAHLARVWHTGRAKFLADINPARIGLTGSTDWDHDVEAQRILGAMLASPSMVEDGQFRIEPNFTLPALTRGKRLKFEEGGDAISFYRPDAIFVERHTGDDGTLQLWRSVLEYERYQSRKDAWCHIERFCGWLHLRATGLIAEPGVLRFVLDSKSRERGYVELIEAFADYAAEQPERMPAAPVRLAVSAVPRLEGVEDVLDWKHWFRIDIDANTSGTHELLLHPPDRSPYQDYFTRSAD